jgi:hypothetical protein
LDCVAPRAPAASTNLIPHFSLAPRVISDDASAISIASSTVISTIVIAIVLARIAVAIARIIITATIIILCGGESGSR